MPRSSAAEKRADRRKPAGKSVTPRRRKPVTTDIVIDADCWAAEPRAKSVVQRAIDAACGFAPPATAGAEIAVMLTDDDNIRMLNKTWRGFDKPTNVLSFPAAPQPHGAGAPALGDIAIAYQTTQREAAAEGKPFAHHLSHLAVHGYLHLMGFDHETDAEAEAMEALERTVLERLGIPDPYAERDRAD